MASCCRSASGLGGQAVSSRQAGFKPPGHHNRRSLLRVVSLRLISRPLSDPGRTGVLLQRPRLHCPKACLKDTGAPGSTTWPEEGEDEAVKEAQAELGTRNPDADVVDPEVDLEFGNEIEVRGIESGDDVVDEELEAIKQSLGGLEVAEEDWDEEELDELFEEFGETISSRPNQAGTGQEGGLSRAPTDEESEGLAVALATAASDTKAGNIRVLDVRPLVYWTQYFVVATAFSRPQMDAMAKRMSDLAEETYGRSLKASERKVPGPWTLLDYGDVVVHLFAPRERERYAIEEFYANAREVALPFEQTASQY